MILAAGLGTRLAPYTDRCPKPLLPLFDVPLIEYGVRQVVAAGIRRIVVNTFHHGEQLEVFLEGLSRRLPERPEIHLSREAILLGTGGGIAQARSFFDGETLLVLNSDLFFDFDLSRLAHLHFERGAAATALLHEGTGFDRLRSTLVDDGGEITWIGPSRPEDPMRRVFAGVYLLEPEAYAPLRPVPSSVISGAFHPLLEGGRPVLGLVEEFCWRDLGTWESYWRFCLEVVGGPVESGLRSQMDACSPGTFSAPASASGVLSGSSYVGPAVTISPGAQVGPGSVLQSGTLVGPHQVSQIVSLPRSCVRGDLSRVVLGSDFEVSIAT